MLPPISDPQFVSQLGQGWGALMLAATGKGLLLLALALGATFLLRRRAAAARHFVWTLAVAGLVALPLLSAVVPAWRVAPLPAVDLSLRADEPALHELQEAQFGNGPNVFRFPGQSPDQSPGQTLHRAQPFEVVTSPSGREALFVPLGQDPVHFTEATGTDTEAGALLPAVLSRSPLRAFWNELRTQAREWHPSVWALLVWEFGALMVAGWFALGLWRVRQLQRRSHAVVDHEWLNLVEVLGQRVGLRRPPRLLWTDDALTPMTWGIRRSVILLPREAQEWTQARRHDVLLHELAHVQRRDILTQLLAQAACVVFWFHPLPWLAAGRMRLERERACDDQVLMAGSRASSYASHLLEMARSLRSEPSLATASVAMARKSQLGERMESLLDENERGRRMGGFARASVLLLAAAVLLPLASLAPVQPLQGEADAAEPERSARASNDGTKLSFAGEPRAYRVAEPTRAPRVAEVPPTPRTPRTDRIPEPPRAFAVSGNVELADGRDSIRMTRGRMWTGDIFGTGGDDYEVDWDDGSFTWREDDYELHVEIEGRVRFAETEDDLEWMEDGAYFELEEERGRDRRRVEFDADRDGNIERRYFEGRKEQEFDADAREWFAKALPAFLTQSGVAVTPRVERWYREDGLDGALRNIDRIEGDHGRLRHWVALLESKSLSADERRDVARELPKNVESDFELARVLTENHEAWMGDDELRDVYFDAAGHLDSDFERGRALAVIVDGDDLTPEQFGRVIVLADGMDSDFEKSKVLLQVPVRALTHPQLQEQYAVAVAGIDSDFERAKTLLRLADSRDLDDATLPVILEMVGDMDSDFEKSKVLAVIAPRTLHDKELHEAYLHSLRTIDSDFEKSKTLLQLIDEGDLDEAGVLGVLETIGEIDSDFEKVKCLTELAPQVRGHEQLEQAYYEVADEIDSEFEYGRAMRALRRR